ncbi:MAG TPA: PAS domain S-box protein, partial [Anaerolineae bacterium]|nr:PAS domain S-box protein [Anaerolineae bacterium]
MHAQVPGVFNAKEAELLCLFATQAAIAIQNARLFQAERSQREQAEALRIQSRRNNRELALLNQVIVASATGQEIESILQMICRELAMILDVPHTAAALLDEEKTEAVLVAGYQDGQHPSVIGLAVATAGNPAAQYLLERKEPLLSEQAQSDSCLEPLHDLLRERRISSLALLPLIVEDEGVGALALGAVAPRTFSSEDVALAQRVAEQASGALARARLVRTQRRLSAAVEHSVEAVVITSEDARILYANPAFERIVGRNRETFIGKSLSTFGSERLMDPSHPDMWQTIRSGNTWQGRLEYLDAEGRTLTLDLTVAPVRDQTGEIVNFVATMRDMSREIQLEKQFHQAQKMEALGRLAGGVAHDFNNLLTVIRLSTHMLQRELDPDDPLWMHTDQIQEASDRAARLTKQLLSFSRRDVVEPKVLNLSGIVSDLSPMLERVIGEEIDLKTALADDLWPVKADLSQMDQVIINLAVNARDAMPDGGTLTFETANVELDEDYAALHMDVRPGEYARLTITDTGTGMDQ